MARYHLFRNNAIFTGLLLLLVVGIAAVGCSDPNRRIRPETIKRMAIKNFQEKGIKHIVDTADVGVLLINKGPIDKWYVAYNKTQTQPALFLYHISNADENPHFLPLMGKTEGKIQHIDFENTTNDDNYELAVEIHYDYDMAYQARELVIIRNPFKNPASEIFSFPYEQVWESIDTFDTVYGLPNHKKRIENMASYEFFDGYILLKGIINKRKNHILEYLWDKTTQQFVLVLDENYHEADEEAAHGHVAKLKGNKILVEVFSHEDNCTAYILEDENGHVIDIEKRIHDELLCSPVAGLSDDGHYLIYTDQHLNAVCLYDIEQQKNRKLLSNFNTYEGVSELVWAKGKNPRFAYVTVNHEEILDNTQLYIFTLLSATGELIAKRYKVPIYYQCDLDGYCAPKKDYHYRFENYNQFIYRTEATGNWKGLRLN